jgi:hypothetical protein
MMSAVPCIATLLELQAQPEGAASSGGHALVTGRVLLQNKLSLAYWGKLTAKSETGARHACAMQCDTHA